MGLEEYARKRKFEKTPEPPPKKAAAAGNRYFIQRHDATRLHYDFRLEIAGTLKSWAVPHGPSLNPGDKRLAMMVEDHPLDYGNFEGNIPKGNYGAGSVMLWDRGTFELLGDLPAEDQIARGDLKFRLEGEKLHGTFAIVRMKNRGKGNEWLLIKKKDEAAQPDWDIEKLAHSVLTGRTQEEIAREMPARSALRKRSPAGASAAPGAVKAEMPEAVTPMQACLAASPPRGAGWLFEIKWDGVRALCYIDHGSTRLRSRKGTAMERQYPELAVLHHYVAAETAILDGEIAVLDEEGRPRFELIQPRIMAAGANSIAHLARSRPVTLFAFDLLYLDGYDLRQSPLEERKRLLASVLKPGGPVRLSEHFQSQGDELLEAARERGLEGIVAKQAASRYVPRRSADWLKIKITHEQDVVICGYTKGEREPFGALVAGVWDKGRLHFAGSVGTGFDQKMMEAIADLLQPLVTEKSPFRSKPDLPQPVTWARPEIVCSVRFANWTSEGRLRAPVFVGLRLDADSKDAVRDADVAPGAEPEGRPPLIPEGRAEATVIVEGRSIHIRNLRKVFYPREGYTKRDLVNYYDAVADLLSPHLKDRPLSLKRYPNGIESAYFFQKDSAGKGFPDWIRTGKVPESEGSFKNYVIGADRPTLIYLTNLGCIDQNPWMSRLDSLDYPDFVLIDLDAQECPFEMIVEAAQLVKKKLDSIGLAGYPKTTGGDGMHIYVPVEPVYTYEQTRSFAEILARLVIAEKPELFTTPRSVSRRVKGKVYFDYLQNAYVKTVAAPYVARAYPGAPVATPLEWREVKPGLRPDQFHIRNAMDRFTRTGDLFAGVLDKPQRLEPALEKLERLVHA